MTEEQETKEQRKKRLQHEAYRRWYLTKGKAYRQKKKEREALEPEVK